MLKKKLIPEPLFNRVAATAGRIEHATGIRVPADIILLEVLSGENLEAVEKALIAKYGPLPTLLDELEEDSQGKLPNAPALP